jgi:site-specific recombinase XerC
LRAKNGTDKASRRSWEIHRGALHGFFAWSSTPDTGTNRPFSFANPAEGVRKFTARQVREEQAAKPITTAPEDIRRILSLLMRWRDGVLVRPYALLYFAGIRPGELKRMAGRERELISLKTRTITIPANVSKTRQERQVKITDNLAAWLHAYPGDIIPMNYEALNKKVRKHFRLSHDEQRHSFISYHVALHRSIGDASLEAGNSEAIVKRHYLNTHTREEGDEFFRITPGTRRAILNTPDKATAPAHLKAI